MRVLLISANTEKINILPIPLGLNCVAVGAREAGHDVRVIDLMTGDAALSRTIADFSPDLIGISVRNIDDQNMGAPRFLLEPIRGLVAECRSRSDAKIVLGGAGFSIFPSGVLKYLNADMGIQGEGEAVFPELLGRIERGLDLSETPGLYLPASGLQGPRCFIRDLDAVPLPDPGISALSLTDSGESWMPVQTRRGCPMSCSYCSTATIEGSVIRRRSFDPVLAQITSHVEAGFRSFYFVDNLFNLPLSYAKELSRRLIDARLGISWRSILYPGRIDRELVGLMAEAGCVEVSLGFESGSEEVLRAMNKRFTPADVRTASEMLRAAGIRRLGFLLFGGPGETKASVEKSLDFAEGLDLDMLKVSTGIRIYPGTSLAETARRDGLISPEDDLLLPRFYMVPELDGWIRETVARRRAGRSNWI